MNGEPKAMSNRSTIRAGMNRAHKRGPIRSSLWPRPAQALLLSLPLVLLGLPALAQQPLDGVSAPVVARYPELGKAGSPFQQEFLRRRQVYAAENPQFTNDNAWAMKLASEVAKELPSFAAKPEIEFKVLLIIKRYSDTWHPLFLPVRSEMTAEDIAKARHCFEVQTPDMVHDITRGKVKFTPTVLVSAQPLRSLNPQRRDSAEYMGQELVNELATFAKPGDYDSVGYYFLYFDNASGYRIPRAGYGVGGFSGSDGIGMFAVGSASSMNPRDEIFLHEWMHGQDGYYGGKSGVRLPKGALHGSGNYDAHYKVAKAWRPQDTFRGYLEWYQDILNCRVPEGGSFVGHGEAAWKHGPMREEAKKKGKPFPTTPLPKGEYPQWVYELMKGNLKNARLGPTLLPAGLKAGEITKDSKPWRLDSWSGSAKTTARYSESDGGSFTLDCASGNNASLRCDAPAEPSANYVLTAEVKTVQVKIEQAGGKYSVLLAAGDLQSTRDLSGSVDWTPIVLPFTTKPDRSSTTVRLQLGGFSSIASGRACFRAVKLQKVAYPVTTTKP
ncbi:MAG: hypothetical protein WCO56_13830 [Verrucomicrobiota bacterium]